MNRYGQDITWSTLTAPHLFSGVCTAYSYRDATQRQLDDDEAGDYRALIQHSQKAELNFEAKISDASTDFLDLSAGAAITVSGITGGIVLASRAIERWTLGQPKTASIQATHYPDMVQVSPDAAGVDLDAFTPSQTGLGIVAPGAKLIYSTFGFTHAAGIVHGLTLTQELTITEDEPSPDGKILGAASHGYLRTLSLLLLAKAAPPAVGTVLAVTGAPTHASGFTVETCEKRYATLRGMMYEIGAVWIPALSAS